MGHVNMRKWFLALIIDCRRQYLGLLSGLLLTLICSAPAYATDIFGAQSYECLVIYLFTCDPNSPDYDPNHNVATFTFDVFSNKTYEIEYLPAPQGLYDYPEIFIGTTDYAYPTPLLAGTPVVIGTGAIIGQQGYFRIQLASGVFNAFVYLSTAPEPSEWVELILGFAGIGVASRYRRQKLHTTKMI
jgi:hypothetical protein